MTVLHNRATYAFIDLRDVLDSDVLVFVRDGGGC